MPIIVTAEEDILVEHEVVIEGPAPEGRFVAIFEDDGETGYFYALDTHVEGNAIQDALHVYNVASIADRAKPSFVKIGWSNDSQKAVLLINDFPHAVFDFSDRRGLCRTGFPPAQPGSAWSTKGHQWDDSAIALFKEPMVELTLQAFRLARQLRTQNGRVRPEADGCNESSNFSHRSANGTSVLADVDSDGIGSTVCGGISRVANVPAYR